MEALGEIKNIHIFGT